MPGFGEEKGRTELPGKKWPVDAVDKESGGKQKKMVGLR